MTLSKFDCELYVPTRLIVFFKYLDIACSGICICRNMPNILSDFLENHYTIVPTKSKRVAHGHIHFFFKRFFQDYLQ